MNIVGGLGFKNCVYFERAGYRFLVFYFLFTIFLIIFLLIFSKSFFFVILINFIAGAETIFYPEKCIYRRGKKVKVKKERKKRIKLIHYNEMKAFGLVISGCITRLNLFRSSHGHAIIQSMIPHGALKLYSALTLNQKQNYDNRHL